MGFGGISIWQLLIVLLIIVLLFGTKKLRNIGTDLGGAIKSFRSSMKDGGQDNKEEDADKEKLEDTPGSTINDGVVKEGVGVSGKKESVAQSRTMFDIGFWELTIIAIIALVVVGPDRLPELARTTGLWLGRARRMFSDVKRDIDRELHAEDLKRIIKPQESDPIHELMEETKTAVDEAGKAFVEAASPEPKKYLDLDTTPGEPDQKPDQETTPDHGPEDQSEKDTAPKSTQ